MTIPSETEALLAALNGQRKHLLGAIEGLSDEDVRRSILPSGWTPIALVQHLTIDVEQFWFRGVVGGEPFDLSLPADYGWTVASDVPSSVMLDRYRAEVAFSDALLASTSPDAAPKWWPEDLFGDYHLHTMREVVLHVMTETATHAGHLDIVRELIDRKQWLVLT
jgi:hypothetical protein